ncbi:acylglycerol kinase [Prionailurus iriomotensis]
MTLDNLLRRAACQEAQVFGNQLIPPNAQVKKATVFLNPAACKGKARTLFEKNAAPILHLSGMDVTVVKTDYEGQAKKLLELLENTDVIIVAGGDGTLQEVITGVLQRADEASFIQHITDATLAIVKGETIPLDVLQIKGEKEKPVFAVTGLRWGSFRDAGVKVSKYWYLGPLKTKAAHFFSTLKKSGLRLIKPLSRTRDPQRDFPDALSQELSPEVWKEVQLSTIELSITTRNSQLDLTSKEDFMNICIEPDTVSKGDFITIGKKGTGGSFSIDSEEYEAMPVEVKLLPRKLQFFCDPRKREQLLPRSAP